MIPNNLIQAAFVTKLKSMANLVAELSSENEIKENQWQGTSFVYPAVRIDLGTQVPMAPGCGACRIPVNIQIHTEDASSKNADIIAGLIAADYPVGLNGTVWSAIIEGIRISGLRMAELIPAVREDARKWKAEARFVAVVEPLV